MIKQANEMIFRIIYRGFVLKYKRRKSCGDNHQQENPAFSGFVGTRSVQQCIFSDAIADGLRKGRAKWQ
jgi:hypothetical protein